MDKKLSVLRTKLVEAQQKLIRHSADAGVLPTDSAVRKISELENAIIAVEHMIEEFVGAKA